MPFLFYIMQNAKCKMQNECVRVADGKRLLLEEKLSAQLTDEV